MSIKHVNFIINIGLYIKAFDIFLKFELMNYWKGLITAYRILLAELSGILST